jgi:hypothetical protein
MSQDQPSARIGAPGPLTQLPRDTPGIEPSPAPNLYASGVAVTLAGNDFSVVLLAPRPSFGPGVPQGAAAFLTEPVASLNLSVRTAKDLYLALNDQLQRYEKQFGKIETEYSRSLEAQK